MLLTSYREACSVLGYADTRLPEIKAYFAGYRAGAVALYVPVPSHAELLAIEDARRCAAQEHVQRLKKQVEKLKDELAKAKEDELVGDYVRTFDHNAWWDAKEQVEDGWRPGRVKNSEGEWIDPPTEPIWSLYARINNY